MSATKIIRIKPNSELADELRRASLSHSTVIVEAGSSKYRLAVEHGVDQEPESSTSQGELSRQAILETAGSWEDVDVEALKSYIRERRLTPSRHNPQC